MGVNLHRIQSGGLPKGGASIVATLGSFDGIHRGHCSLLSKVVEVAARRTEGRSGLISFYPHPAQVLGKAPSIPALTTLRQRIRILAEVGLTDLFLIHFTPRMAGLTAREFIERFLLDSLKVESLIIGPDARIGRGGEGTTETISSELDARGREVVVLPFLEEGGDRISSRRIRTLIQSGEVARAALALGRPFTLDARVVAGDGRGNTIGFPTANLHSSRQVLPQRGVYATTCTLRGQRYLSVTNVGERPTFQGRGVRAECHLLDYRGDSFRGQRVEVAFHERIRDELAFHSVDALCEQIKSDCATARRIVAITGNHE